MPLISLCFAALLLGDDAAPADMIGNLPYVRLDTREATLTHMLDLLVPEKGHWGPWQLLSPFPFSGAQALGNGELKLPLAPEDELSRLRIGGDGPDLSRVYRGKNGVEVRWAALAPEKFAPGQRMDLRVFEDADLNENAVCYLYTTVECAQAVAPVIPLGSDDGIRIWLNGRLIHDMDVPRGLNPDDDHVRFPFEAGTNHVLFKISQGSGGWDFQITTRESIDAALDATLYYYLDRDFPLNRERSHYQVLTYPLPDDVVLETGGLSFLKDGRPVVSTRRGDVYLIDNAYDVPPANARYVPFARGLHEILGTLVRQDADGESIWVVQRGELTRLRDTDGDDRADRFETMCDGWGISGNYHEFAFGPEFDDQGNAWVTLNVGFCGSLGKASVPYRGSCIKIAPDGDITFVCDGLRSPNGIAPYDGQFFYVDNQGDYVATNKLSHLKPGTWHGHPASLRWRDLKDGERPPRQPPAVWFPYARMGQSVADIEPIVSHDKFGPFEGQLLVGDQLAATIMRVSLEQVEGHYQGACYPFLEGLACGVNRLRFAPDGSLFAGETDRGWGSVGRKRHGIERITYRDVLPFEILAMTARPDGFTLTFTKDVDAKLAGDPAAYRMVSHTYEYHSDYGAPEDDIREHRITSATVLDQRTVHLVVENLRRDSVFGVDAKGVLAAGTAEPLLHSQAWYTLINIPGQPPFDAPPAKDTPRLLFLSHSAGFVHDVVKRPRPEVLSLAEDTLTEAVRGRYLLDCTQDCSAINAENLANYAGVVFYTTGELPIAPADRQALFDFIRNGGAFIGIHPATDTWYEVPQYVDLIGGTFDGHPWHQEVTIDVADAHHPATAHLGESFRITDEIYQFRNFQRDPLHALLTLDPKSVDIDQGKRADHDYAVAWCKDYGAGRLFYTALGHRAEVWKDARFKEHLIGGIGWALRGPDYLAPPPPGATVLYAGGEPTGWHHRDGSPAKWRPVDEAMEIHPGSGDIVSNEEFEDFLLHIEFMTPAMSAELKGQARGNSGVYLHGRYEVQVLDSFGLVPGLGDCGALYGKKAPEANACRPTEHWQTYDIRFRAPRFDDAGNKQQNAMISVWQNGYPIYRDFPIDGPTGSAALAGEGKSGPIQLQDHGHTVRYRNIWVSR